MKINKDLWISQLPIKTSKSTSSSDIYACTYINSQVDTLNNSINSKYTTPTVQNQWVGNLCFTKWGHIVLVHGWYTLNGSSANITVPWAPHTQTWVPVNGINNSLGANAGCDGFILLQTNKTGNIKMSGATTYMTGNFAYYTNS